MNIGIVCWWYNRGQANVGRYIRSIFDALGHNTFILARPSREGFDASAFIDSSGVWAQPQVTYASHTEIPLSEYISWAESNSLDVIFFDQNYQFIEITQLRKKGIKTIGRFVWEFFSKDHVPFARLAFDTIYCFTQSEQERYRSFGLNCPRICWGCHPELFEFASEKKQEKITFFYQAGFMDYRKPVCEIVTAFSHTTSNAKLIIKMQTKKDKKYQKIKEMEPLDSRIEIIQDDLPAHKYYQLFSSCHVCLAPSRWEGLGLALYEAIAFGLPIITNDNPPMNEVVKDGYNGLLVKSHQKGTAPSGIFAYEPDQEDLTQAIEKLSLISKINSMQENINEMQQQLNWEKTKNGFAQLIG